MENPNASTAAQVERCDLCGTPLALSAGAPGCLHCLLAGGRDGAEERRYQHYEVAVHEDGLTPSELGRGAMGITYRALDLNLGAPVALKVISARYSNQREARDRFRQEARAAAQLRHPNVASVYHFGETAGGQCFYAMELVEGETLEARLRREGPLGAEVVLEVAIQVARALLAAENHGLVHRDLKPSNLMLVPNESGDEQVPGVKVIDFGLAKAITSEGQVLNPTETGFAGTPGFASPEQSQADGGKLDTRSDIFSLGATLWFALTEEVLPSGDTLPVERLVARKVPAPMIRLLRRALATDPTERPQSARALLAELELCRAAMRAARWRRRLRPALLAALALGIAAFFFWRSQAHDPTKAQARPAPLALSEKRIAVLPFENLSSEKENAFFTLGVHDDILSALAKVADLKVIARTSVMNYNAGPGRDRREIGRALGVSKVLEGKVRREGEKVRVTAQLIDTATDTQLWAETYDRNRADVFAMQSEIAKAIADRLQATLSPMEKAAMARPPTNDLTAFDLYTRAKAITLTANFSALGEDKLLRAVDLLDQAVTRDPAFFLAWCQLGVVHDQLYFLGIDHTPARLGLGDAAVQKALQLQPDSGEAHLVLAQHYYRGSLDYERAKTELAIAQRTLPNDPQIFELAGYIDRRQGRWEESTRNLGRALELDPRNFFTLQQIALSYEMLRRYPAMVSVLDQALAIVPRDVETRVARALVDLDWHADPGPLRNTIDAILAEDPAAAPTIADNWLTLGLCERDPVSAERARLALDDGGVQISAVQLSRPFWEGMVARIRGDDAAARAAFSAARAHQAKMVRAEPNYAPALCVLGLIDASLGRTEDALREGRQAMKMLPVARDSINGAYMIEFFAMSCAWAGEKDLAFQHLALATRQPGTLSYGQLRLHPFWDPLRGDPRFDEIVAALAPAAATAGKSIAVLPFANLSSDPDNAYFADGVKDEILTYLSKIAALKVISRGSTEDFTSARNNLREIAGQLGVENILRGSVRKAGETVRVTVQLINAPSGTQLWADTYDRKLIDMLEVESEVAQRIAGALEATLTGAEKRALEARPMTNVEAYQSYLKGRYFWNKRTEDGYQKAAAYFRQAIAIDPHYAPAYAGLSDADQFIAFNTVPSTELYAKARAAAEKAIKLDETLAEPHASLGLLAMNYDWDWESAGKEFKRAIELNPNYATAHHWYAEYLIAVGRPAESFAEIKRAQELDPLSLIINTDTGKVLYFSRRYDEAEAQLVETLRMDPDFPQAHIWLGYLYATRGQYTEAIAEFQRVGDNAWALGWLGYVYGASGQRKEAERVRHELEQAEIGHPVDPANLLNLSLGLGEKDQAFAALEKECEIRSVGMTSLKVNPWYDGLRSDPRFADFLRRTNLAP